MVVIKKINKKKKRLIVSPSIIVRHYSNRKCNTIVCALVTFLILGKEQINKFDVTEKQFFTNLIAQGQVWTNIQSLNAWIY